MAEYDAAEAAIFDAVQRMADACSAEDSSAGSCESYAKAANYLAEARAWLLLPRHTS